MNPLAKLTDAVIRQHTSPESFERGRDYFEQGAVLRVVRRGSELLADVEGSQYTPYRVRIVLDPGGVSGAACTCPYDWGGWCKHIAAALLYCIHEPEEVDERPGIEETLSGLEPEQLQALVLKLVEQRPDLVELIESYALAATAPRPQEPGERAARQRRTPIDPEVFRRQVRAALHSLDRVRGSDAYWHVGSVVAEVREVLERAQEFLEAGDGHNALLVVDAVTEEYMNGWVYLDGSNGETGDFFSDLAPVWTEALLAADLTPEQRHTWAEKLAHWQEELDDYGLEGTFDAALAAAEQGWDYPPLQRVLRGEGEGELTGGREAAHEDELVEARLRILDRQERHEEYLRLAAAEGEVQRYACMLVKLGRVQEAVECGLASLSAPGEALALARALREKGAIGEAVRVARHGLDLSDGWAKAPLARWLSEVAASAGRPEQALEAALVAFREDPSLAAYQAVEALAGARWAQLRDELLDHLRRTGVPREDAQVEIFLHEGLIDDAVAVVEKHPSYGLVEPVVDAAMESRPDWAISACRGQAEPIMDEGRSRQYHHAARWLEKARAAYKAAGREAEWIEYLESLIARHKRKYSLVPLLEALKKQG